MLKIIAGLVAGAYATSFAEYRFDYNLYDFTVDKIKAAVVIAQRLLASEEGK